MKTLNIPTTITYDRSANSVKIEFESVEARPKDTKRAPKLPMDDLLRLLLAQEVALPKGTLLAHNPSGELYRIDRYEIDCKTNEVRAQYHRTQHPATHPSLIDHQVPVPMSRPASDFVEPRFTVVKEVWA